MAEFVKIGTAAEMPKPGQAKEFEVNGRVVCVANVDGTLCAMDNLCVHLGGPLGQGSVERGKLVCPWHGWEFNPFTGAAVHNSERRLRVYGVRAEDEDVLVEAE